MAEYDPVAILRALVEEGVDFVVVGGVAARLRGAPILTQDIDITPRQGLDNLEALARALEAVDARLRTPADPDGVELPFDPHLLAAGRSWTFVTAHGDLDLVFEPAGSRGYDDLVTDSDELEVAPALRVAVASLADVIRTKEAAGRAKDLAAVPLLRATLEEVDRRSS